LDPPDRGYEAELAEAFVAAFFLADDFGLSDSFD
jgi:hypothetical protein